MRRGIMPDTGDLGVGSSSSNLNNIVNSCYDEVHGGGQFERDKVRGLDRAERPATRVAEKSGEPCVRRA